MSKLALASAELSGGRMSHGRTQPLFVWFLNTVTVAVVCLLLLKLYKNFLLLYEWFRPVKNISKRPNILVLGPNNEMIQAIVNKLSRTFQSDVIECRDVDDNSSRVFKTKKKLGKSQIIVSHMPINSREAITEFKAHVEKTFGVVDILVVSQNEETVENKSTHCFLDHLNQQLLSQFWAVMAFLPGMLSRNEGLILSVALGKSSLTNTGIMRSIHEELLQLDTKVKLTIVESNTIFNNCYLPPLSVDVLARLIVWSMWTCSPVVKVPSVPSYVIMIPIEVVRYVMKPVLKVINLFTNDFYARRCRRGKECTH